MELWEIVLIVVSSTFVFCVLSITIHHFVDTYRYNKKWKMYVLQIDERMREIENHIEFIKILEERENNDESCKN